MLRAGAQVLALQKHTGGRKVKTYWFGSAKWFWLRMLRLVAKQSLRDLLSRWVAISSSLPPICSPSFSFMDGVGKSKILNLDVRKI
jgi:hypothetical protein